MDLLGLRVPVFAVCFILLCAGRRGRFPDEEIPTGMLWDGGIDDLLMVLSIESKIEIFLDRP